MRNSLCLLLMIFSTSAFSSTFTWTLEVIDSKTSESKTYRPLDSDFSIPLPKFATSCVLKAIDSKDDAVDKTHQETRQIICHSNDAYFLTTAYCQKGSSAFVSVPAASGLKEGRKAYLFDLRCND